MKITDSLTFGDWLKGRMEAQGLTVPALATAVSRGLVAVFNWRNGTYLPPSTVQARLASTLGVGVDEVRLRAARDRRAHAQRSSTPVSA
jgi:hypothetical protein